MANMDSPAQLGPVHPVEATHGFALNGTAEIASLKRWDTYIRRTAHLASLNLEAFHVDEDDLAQEIRIRLVRALCIGGGRLPDAYVRRVIRNATRTALRDSRAAVSNGLAHRMPVEDLPAPQDFRDSQIEGLVRLWVVVLPVHLQRLYKMLYVGGLTQREAATILGVTQPRVAQLHRDLLTRARENLQHLVAA